MRAVVYPGYGSVDAVQITDIETPTPSDDEVLIQVHSTVVTRSDITFRTGKPFIGRLFSGIDKPKKRPGSEFAGEIKAVGPKVTQFETGDRVVGSTVPGMGAHAEYVCLPEDGVIQELPASLTYEETAGVCDGGLTALYFLKEKAEIQPDYSVLINGASGAVGTYAVQLATHYGADVTGVCSTSNVELVRSLGAEKVIDYTEAEFTDYRETYDVIFDTVGTSSFSQCKPLLTQQGVYLATVPSMSTFLHMMWTSKRRGKKAIFAATGLNQLTDDLHSLTDLLDEGEIQAVIDRRYPFEQIAEAHKYVEQGHKKGNVVIAMA
jgi:NADPH:quinone reductase-like Zn-dependent oxidoreductase